MRHDEVPRRHRRVAQGHPHLPHTLSRSTFGGDMRARPHVLMHLDLDHQTARGAVRYSSIARDRGRKVSTWSPHHKRLCDVSSRKGPKVLRCSGAITLPTAVT